jgi:hypothetical protein
MQTKSCHFESTIKLFFLELWPNVYSKTCPQRNRWFQDKSSLKTGFRCVQVHWFLNVISNIMRIFNVAFGMFYKAKNRPVYVLKIKKENAKLLDFRRVLTKTSNILKQTKIQLGSKLIMVN